jgi:membrane-bound metal-dependent hydrolase YbcI (DUF457 family)
MASPIGHALVGIGLAAIAAPLAAVSPSPALWVGAVIASGAPDLDILGCLLGLDHERVHRSATHSLIVLGLFVLAALWVSRRFAGVVNPDLILVWSVVLLSHPLVDLVTTGPPITATSYGVGLFWPVVSRRLYVRRPLVRPPSLDHYTSGHIWHRLWPEVRLFGSACVTLLVLGHVL